MSRPNPTALLGFFVAVLVAICGVSVAKGGLYIGKHELDTLHLLEMVFRMAAGEWPHLDFVTPIGALAVWPIAIFVQAGYGAGMAIILSQALVGAVALPMAWWAAASRLSRLPAYLFGLFVIVLIGALVHGEAERSISISMHYNRWAWGFAFIAIILSLVEPARRRPVVDGVMIGLSMFILLMIKVTYFGSFAIPVVLALVLRGARRELIWALATGIALAILPTVFGGLTFWFAYAGDLLYVAGSDVRSFPSGSLNDVVGSPPFIGASMLLVASVILLRQSDKFAGLILWLLAPGFVYVTYQNFANDPQWLYLLAVILFAFRPDAEAVNGWGWNLKNAVTIAGAMALAFSAPSFANLAYSPFRHSATNTELYIPFFRESAQHDDLFTARVRGYRADVRAPLDVAGTPAEEYADIEEKLEPAVFQGETLPVCSLELGMIGWFQAMADDLEAAGFGGPDKVVLTADLVSSIWLFGEFRPVPGGAPWYYGQLPGLESADYLLVPLCPATHDIRTDILADVDESGLGVTEVRRTKLYILYELSPAA